MQTDFPCTVPGCNRTFKRLNNRTQHHNTYHRPISPDLEADPAHEFRENYHPKLNALPCDRNGRFLPDFVRPSPPETSEGTKANKWHPFDDRLAFDWAHYHFVELQSAERQINKGLDLWLAAQLKAGDGSPLPWTSAQEMYRTIDEIQEGDAPFETFEFKYAGEIPNNPPSWMTTTYELCTRNSRLLLHHQLATSDFTDKFDTRPYRQFDYKGDRVWSNLMSGDWAWNEANTIANDPKTHGSMLVPIISGSDKTTVSVATGHQEYHPVYQSPGNLSNVARRAHGNAVLPVAFLPIPKTNKRQRKNPEFQRFTRQMYHACLARIFEPLREGMSTPDIVRCPDGHYRRAIYSLGPYIADYPEQVWLAGVVQNWCPKCEAHPKNLDENFKNSRRRKHERSDFIIRSFDPGTVWEKYGIRSDVVPFTHSFPRADIHTLLSPDLLHQLIKGTFKDHLVTWVNEYLHIKHGENRALEIIRDIDKRISVVPPYAGLRRFSEGRDFEQWTGDDSKALMKVYVAAIAGHVPPRMVQCLSKFMDLCYIFRRNVISSTLLMTAEALLQQFHELRQVFTDEGVRESISLPRQHSLLHYIVSIPLFGSPNGLCSSITESKHIKAVKEPWRRSSRFKALAQMLRVIVRLDKLATLRRRFLQQGMLIGSTASAFIANLNLHQGDGDGMVVYGDTSCESDDEVGEGKSKEEKAEEECIHDAEADTGPHGLSSISLARSPERNYPKGLDALAEYINEPGFPLAFKTFLYGLRHPKRRVPDDIHSQIQFCGKIQVFHSACARFYAPSDLCGLYGMYRQRIRCTPHWYGSPRYDTVFVVEDETKPGFEGMMVARVRLLFSFTDDNTSIQCALVSWYLRTSATRCDHDTGMWTVKPEGTRNQRPLQVIPLESIARGAHLLPKYGLGILPDYITYINALDEFSEYFVNPYIDHHCHEFLSS